MTSKEFFGKYPNAPGFFRVGRREFLLHREAAARRYALLKRLKLKKFKRPKATKKDKTDGTAK